jgi:hypothetical protein
MSEDGFGNDLGGWPDDQDQQQYDELSYAPTYTFSSLPSVVSWFPHGAYCRLNMEFSQQDEPHIHMDHPVHMEKPAENPMYEHQAQPMSMHVEATRKSILPPPSASPRESQSQAEERRSKRERKKTELFSEAEEQEQHLTSSSGSKPKKPKPAESKGVPVPKFWRSLFDRKVPNPPGNELVPPYILQMQGALHGFYVGCPVQVDIKDGRGWQRGYVGSLKRDGPFVTLSDGREVPVDFSKNVR